MHFIILIFILTHYSNFSLLFIKFSNKFLTFTTFIWNSLLVAALSITLHFSCSYLCSSAYHDFELSCTLTLKILRIYSLSWKQIIFRDFFLQDKNKNKNWAYLSARSTFYLSKFFTLVIDQGISLLQLCMLIINWTASTFTLKY